jgi:hypothetical protein
VQYRCIDSLLHLCIPLPSPLLASSGLCHFRNRPATLQPNVRINTDRHIASSSDSKSLAQALNIPASVLRLCQRHGNASVVHLRKSKVRKKQQPSTTTLHLFACATLPAAIDPREKIRLTSCHTTLQRSAVIICCTTPTLLISKWCRIVDLIDLQLHIIHPISV